jgi:hypothetical protein
MEHIWSVICQYALISQQTRNASLIEVVEGISFHLDPIAPDDTAINLPVNLHLVSMWWRSNLELPEKSKFRVLILDPARNPLQNKEPLELDINLENYTRFRSTIFSNLSLLLAVVYTVLWWNYL